VDISTAVGFDGVGLELKNIGAGLVTLDANGSETIDGSTTLQLSQYQAVALRAVSGNWYII
jgi:hypothetical protein